MELYKGKYWEVIFIESTQEFVGQCIISNNKKALNELSNDEWVELGKIEKELERITKKLFNSTMYNFSCLMNNAYRDGDIPHVHFHFIPRYRDDIVLFNKTYRDKHFGYNFWKWSNSRFKRQKDIFTNDEKLEIFKLMKKEFNMEPYYFA